MPLVCTLLTSLTKVVAKKFRLLCAGSSTLVMKLDRPPMVPLGTLANDSVLP